MSSIDQSEVHVKFIQTILRKLFLKYASSATKLSLTYIRLNKYIQLMTDAGVTV